LKLIATKLQNTTQSLITISSKSIATAKTPLMQLTKQKHYLHKQSEREITKKKPLQK
jgi:hypothetical protein